MKKILVIAAVVLVLAVDGILSYLVIFRKTPVLPGAVSSGVFQKGIDKLNFFARRYPTFITSGSINLFLRGQVKSIGDQGLTLSLSDGDLTLPVDALTPETVYMATSPGVKRLSITKNDLRNGDPVEVAVEIDPLTGVLHIQSIVRQQPSS